jgi:threonine/homoserine/homoserine lactone efflux protein
LTRRLVFTMAPLFDTPTLLTFGLASAALVAAPGPGQALVLTRTLQGGARAGVLTACGLEVGTAVHTLAAALGLSAVLARSAMAFTVVKYFGASYLVLLGLLALRASAPARGASDRAPQPPPPAHLLAHAAVTGVLNPKVALFFLAFLPQFVNPSRGRAFLQFVLLGLGFTLLGLIGDSLVAVIAGGAQRRLLADRRWARWRERLTGTILVALGLRLALVRPH